MADNGGYHPNTAEAAPPPSPSDIASDSINFTLDSGDEEQFGRAPYDAAESQDVMGNPKLEETELWGEEAAAFIASAPGGEYGPSWVGKRPLGQGGFGRAGLWERYDDEGNVQERMVIKENMREREMGEWDSHVPPEVYIMKRLDLAECPTIVRLLNYKRFPTAQTHRLYLEYCPHGDLRKLYKRYKAWRRYLPEAFLWHVFHDLVEAGMAMFCGPGYKAYYQAWAGHEVVHRDIKPGNIFLGEERPPHPNSVVASHYPTAKMGDFGLAIVTGPSDTDNPRKYRRAGTPGYRAPEQEARHKPNEQPPWMAGENDQILWWTNVWAIGVVMYELTTLHRAARVLYNQPDAEGRGCPAIWTNNRPEYSPQLCDTIRDCLNMNPDDRVTLLQLRQITRRFARMSKDQLAWQRTAPDVPCEEERVYYRDNEINDMAPGGDYIPSRVHGQMMRESGFWNPDVSVLRYPNFTPFEESDEAGDVQDEAEMAEAEDEEEEGEVRESRTMRAPVQPTADKDEDGMDVDEPTVVPGGQSETVRADVERPAPDARFAGMRTNAFGKPRMGAGMNSLVISNHDWVTSYSSKADDLITDQSYLHKWGTASLEELEGPSHSHQENAGRPNRSSIAKMSYGKRLIPVLIDEAARDTPDKVYASIPRSSDLSEGFEDITYKRFANAINRVAAWLDSTLGGRGTTGAFAYAGPKDLRYMIITVAAVKSGREVRGTGPRLDRVVGAAADTGSQIVLPSPFAALEGQLQVLDSTKCHTYLCPVSTVPMIGKARAERPGMQLLVVPGCEEWLNEETVGDYRYGKTFEEAKEDTFMIVHTSGTTGLPKPIRYTNGSVATFDAQQNLPDPEGKLWWHLMVGSRMFCPMPTLHIAGMVFSLLIPTFFAVVAVIGPGDTPVSVETAEQLHRYGHVDGVLYPPSLLEDFCRSSASLESLEKLQYIFYGGSPLENSAGEVLSKVAKLVNLMGTTECGVLPVFQQSSPDWSCFRFHSFLDYQMESRHSGTFELVLTQTDRSKECSTTFHHYPHLQEFRTKDLYVKHPTKEDLWIYRGRTDDLIILSHGQTLDPATMEAMINGHPHVRSAIIGGDGRARPFLIVEQTIDSRSPGHDRNTRLDDIWPVIEEANGLCSEYVRLTRPLVILSSPEKPFERLAKGSVNRRGTLREYQHEIDAAYNKLDPKEG